MSKEVFGLFEENPSMPDWGFDVSEEKPDLSDVDLSWLEGLEGEVIGMAPSTKAVFEYGRPGYCGRPVERIDGFLEELGRLWKIRPDWRFGQLICNLDRYYRVQHEGNDFFYLEEDEFLVFVDSYLRGR